ncbi:hypothetical protein KBC75_03710 [Candidatus Shapirobacteria bacterium]|nr:hypothetical protein [Candidatus Shapirobacteria bacterium]
MASSTRLTIDVLHKPGLRIDALRIGLPEDLNGKVVVELFAGERGESMRDLVGERGGAYVAVDKRVDDRQHVDFRWDVLTALKGFSDESADFIIGFGPLWWGRSDANGYGIYDLDKTMSVVWEAMRVVKKRNW